MLATPRPRTHSGSGSASSAMSVRLHTLLALLVLATAAHAFVDDAIEVIKLSKEIGEEILGSWDVIGKPFNATGGVDLPIVRRKERIILAKLAQVSRAIQKLELSVDRIGSVAMLLAKHGTRGTRVELRLNEMSDFLSRVTSADRMMREYVRLQQELERSTLENFAEWCVSHDPSALPGLLERVHSLIVPPHKHLLGQGLFQLILDYLQGQDMSKDKVRVIRRRNLTVRNESLIQAGQATLIATTLFDQFV